MTRAASPPTSPGTHAALDLISSAIEAAGFKPGADVALALDVAATEFFRDGAYQFEKKAQQRRQMSEFYVRLLDAYPLVSIEDPLTRTTGTAGPR